MTSRVAIVCDEITEPNHLTAILHSLHDIFPRAPIYTTYYEPSNFTWLQNADVRTNDFQDRFLNHKDRVKYNFFEHLDLSRYDLIFSVTESYAKCIKKGSAKHICYCYSPTAKYCSNYDDYMHDPGFGRLNSIVRIMKKISTRKMRRRDYRSTQDPDYIITPSTFSSIQIKKYYGRESNIIAPPVPVEKFCTGKFSTAITTTKEGKSQVKQYNKNIKRQGYISTVCQDTTERLDLAVKACKRLNEPLILIGDGPEHERLQKFVDHNPLITFIPTATQAMLKKYFSESKGYLLPGTNPFSIDSIEALAAGCPVIAYSKSGASDYIIDGKNGILFNSQSTNSLVSAIKKNKFLHEKSIQETSIPFSEAAFKNNLKTFLRTILTS